MNRMHYPPTRTPSVQRLQRELRMTPEQAKAVKRLLKRGPECTPFHHPSHAIAAWLGEINTAAGGVANGFFGVESGYPEKEWLWYLNTGDTYSPTLVYIDKGQGHVALACWGAYFE